MTPAAGSRVAVIGLGAMGSRIAARLLTTGCSVVVWNRSLARADRLKALGAEVADTPAAAASNADVVATVLADETALEAVSTGPTGLLAGLHDGATIFEMSTVGPSAIARLRESLPRGANILDAPMLGSIGEADAGTLVLLVGGPKSLVARHRPLLSALGTVEHVGPLGTGAAAKLVANSTLVGSLALLAEAITLADGLGLSRQTTRRVLERTPLAAQAARRWTQIEGSQYPPRFTLALACKDAELVTRTGAEAGVEMRLAQATSTWLLDALDSGWGGHDYTALAAHVLDQRVDRVRTA